MTINSAHRYLSNVWDWGMFNGCFDNPRIALSDLDGAIERNGYLLIVETKSPSADLSGGQRIMFTNLCRTRLTSVIVVWGQPQQPTEAQIYHLGYMRERLPCDRNHLRMLVSMWHRWAGDQPPAWTLTSRQPKRVTAGRPY